MIEKLNYLFLRYIINVNNIVLEYIEVKTK